jgi:hypothetical protein
VAPISPFRRSFVQLTYSAAITVPQVQGSNVCFCTRSRRQFGRRRKSPQMVDVGERQAKSVGLICVVLAANSCPRPAVIPNTSAEPWCQSLSRRVANAAEWQSASELAVGLLAPTRRDHRLHYLIGRMACISPLAQHRKPPFTANASLGHIFKGCFDRLFWRSREFDPWR